MKNILFALIFVFALSVFSTEYNPLYANDCFVFDGTYIGAAILTSPDGGKKSRPLFIIVANKHITGFFAPENQTHPGGSSFNLGDLTVSSVYTLSLTADDKILIKNADGTLSGKAKLVSVPDGSGSFSGFYNSDIVDEFVAGDFLNIGSDGGAIIKIATDVGVVHAFGKMNPSGEFVQVFPEKGRGPRVNISISGNTADIEVFSKGDSFTTTLRKFSGTSCNGDNPTSSSGGTPSDKPAFITNFQSALDSSSMLSSTSLPGAERELLVLQDTIRKIKLALLLQPSDCNNLLATSLESLPDVIKDLQTACQVSTTCIAAHVFTFEILQEDQLTIKDNGSLDENSNGISDICEQSSVLDEEETLSLVFITFNNALKDIAIYFKTARKEARKLFGKENNGEGFFTRISKSLKRIQTALKAPVSLCNIGLQVDVQELLKAISDATLNNYDTNSSIMSGDADLLDEALNKLSAVGKTINPLIKVDSNKNEISDVCE